MVRKQYKHVKQNTMYKLLNKYKKTSKLIYTTWIDLSTAGVKPHLLEDTTIDLIDKYKITTEGG